MSILMDYFNEIRDGIGREWLKIGKPITKLERHYYEGTILNLIREHIERNSIKKMQLAKKLKKI